MSINQQFREYTTSTAFSLNLSRKMCLAILIERQGGAERYRLNVATYRALEDRGLVFWRRVEGKPEFGGLTMEGNLVGELLERAGMSVVGLFPPHWRDESYPRCP